MQQLLANYLFQYKNCPLPQIGTLYIVTEPAISEIGTQIIRGPVNTISFTKDIKDSKDLIKYIAVNKGLSAEEAAYQLNNIANDILHLKGTEEFNIPNAGVFTKSQNDELSFIGIKEAEYLKPLVYAERVIHPEDSHSILVGDKETDRNSMTEFFTETIPDKKDKWWIWAAALFIISLILIFFYLNNDPHNSLYGVSQKAEVPIAPVQYKNIP